MAFCNGCRSQIKILVNRIDKALVDHANTALAITTKLKTWLSSDIAIIITELIPGTYDDALREFAVKALTEINYSLGLFKPSDNPLTDEQKILLTVQRLKSLTPESAKNYLSKIGSQITAKLDKRYKDNFYDLAFQAIFSLTKVDA